VRWFQSRLAGATERVAGCGKPTTSLEVNCEQAGGGSQARNLGRETQKINSPGQPAGILQRSNTGDANCSAAS